MKKALIFDCYDDFNIRIQYIQKAFVQSGYEVKTFFGDFNHTYKEKYQTFRENVTYIPVRPYQKNLSIARLYSHYDFAKSCRKMAEQEKDVDIIYVMAPPNSMVEQFARFKKEHPNVKVWVDVLDMWPESLPISDTMKKLLHPALQIWQNSRDHYIGQLDYVTAECDLFKDVLEQKVDASRIETIYLCQDQHPITQRRKLDENIRFLYMGSISHLIDIDLIVKFLSTLQKKRKITLEIIGDGENRETFLTALDENQIPYTYHGFVYDDDKKNKIYQKCHFGLNLMKHTVFVGLTMKSLDYFSHELPIINNIVRDSRDIVQNHHIGMNLSYETMDDVVQDCVALDEKTYQEMVDATNTVFQKKFSSEIVVQQFMQCIQTIEQL